MKVKVQKILRLDQTKNGNKRFLVLVSLVSAYYVADENVLTVIARSDDESMRIREGAEIDVIPIREVPYILNGVSAKGLDGVLGSVSSRK